VASYHHIILHNIASFIILHHRKQWEKKENCSFKDTTLGRVVFIRGLYLWQRYSYATSTTRPSKLLQQRRRISFFFMKREKKGRCFFTCSSKMVRSKISWLTKKYITSLTIQIVDNCFLQKEAAYKNSKV
jgi:hypothetical protein